MAEPATASSAAGVPAFSGRRVLYLGTGALGVMFMPMWLHWFRASYPDVEVRPVITRSAARFVTPTALAVYAKVEVGVDAWDDVESHAPHVELAEWADTVIVHPATFHFTSRLALGIADTPALLALHCTKAPIAVAPALPPGAADSPVWHKHLAALASRPNVTVVPPIAGISLTTGRPDAMTAAPLPEVVAAAEALRARGEES